MSEFERMHAKMKRAYDGSRYEEALSILAKMEECGSVPSEKEWMIHQAKGMSLFWLGLGEAALAEFEAAIQTSGDMPIEMKRHTYSNYLMYLHYLSGISDEAMRAAHDGYAALVAGIQPYVHEKHIGKKKLRIGYISPDLVDHVVLNFAIQLFAAYDRTRYEVVLYGTGKRKNEVTDWVAGLVNGYRDLVALSPEEAARQIHEDEVDILFDLSGHCAGGGTLEVLAYRPAPVQLCGIGYFDTTGLPAVDAFLGDVYCDPDGADAQFVEKLLRLPHSHFCFTPSERFAQFAGEYRLHSPIVFGSFNNFAKITDEMLSAWKAILDQVEGSRLVLKNVTPRKEPLAYMRKRMGAIGFRSEQVDLRPATPDYLKDYMDVDIILDTYPYVGGGTTCEALYMGVPVVTRYGARHGSRFGLSLLENIGLGELAAPTLESYIERAVMLAGQGDLVAALHANLRKRMLASPVMDGRGYTREVEAAFEMLWEDWLSH